MQELAGFVLMTSLVAAAVWVATGYRAGGPGLPLWGLPFLLVILSSLFTAPVSTHELNNIVRQPEEIGLPPNPTTDSWFGEPADCGGDGFFSPVCHEYRPVMPTLLATALPGLLSLLPFLWLVYRDPAVRMAALVAGSFGAIRFAVPVIILLRTSERIAAPDGQDYFKYYSGDPAGLWIWIVGVLLSIVSLIIWFVFARDLSRRSPDVASPS